MSRVLTRTVLLGSGCMMEKPEELIKKSSDVRALPLDTLTSLPWVGLGNIVT